MWKGARLVCFHSIHHGLETMALTEKQQENVQVCETNGRTESGGWNEG